MGRGKREEGSGELMWWYRQSMHRANPYTNKMTARDVRRSTIIDDGPLAFGVSKEDALRSVEK